MTRHVVARADDIPVGERKCVTASGRELVVFNVDGEYFALFNHCPHRGARLSSGRLVGSVVSSGYGSYDLTSQGYTLRCPWHGWEFDLRTGRSYCDADRVKARRFEVQEVPGRQLVEGPYRADTFEVEREGDYLVVEM
ncbi:MAG: Rieske (2Fe-2S) protein [Pseudomonadota bacterium]